jgi:hypothetical protein
VLENKSILELQHGLNTTVSLYLMRHVYDDAILPAEDIKYSDVMANHAYWGPAQKYIDMVKTDNKYVKRVQQAGGLIRVNL